MTTRRLTRSLLAGAVVATAAATVAIVVPASAAASLYEAESATLSQATVASDHTGFTGTGFVDYTNVAGGYVEFTVTAAQAQNASLVFRYANGTTVNRPMTVTVNGATAASGVAFNGTGAWTTWKTQTVTAALVAGSNVVRATATTANGGPNLDSLSVDGQVQPPPSSPPSSTDWAKAVADSTIARETPAQFGGWGYPQALTLWGIYLVYERTHDAKYLTYIRAWADRFVGRRRQHQPELRQPGQHAGRQHPGAAVQGDRAGASTRPPRRRSATGSNTYPRTTDGGWWHSTSASRKNQLWADGVFMVLPFLVAVRPVGRRRQTTPTARRPSSWTSTASHLRDRAGLLRHA